MPGERLIEVTNLAKALGGQMVVQGVSLTLAPGEILGLVGASGSGKTTTLRMVAGLLRPDAGSGQVLGEEVGAAHHHRRARIGYMGHRLGHAPEQTVLESLSQSAEDHGVAVAHRAIAAAVERYGLRPLLDTRFSELSGDWARRVQFVAAILHQPPLLLLDEPTSGFDGATRCDIWRWIEELAAEGRGVVISTHDIADAERCHSLVVYRGRQAQRQRPADLARDALAAEVFGTELAPCAEN